MRTIKEPGAITARIAEIESQLKMVEAAIEKQMALPFFSRSRDYCLFLHMERKIFTAKLDELKWILYA
jgi:hypothetical protein